MLVNINNIPYNINEDEFKKINHNTYHNLCIRENVGLFERIISLLVESSQTLNITNSLFYEQTNGGFIPINCSSQIENVYIKNTSEYHIKNIKDNIELHKIKNIKYVSDLNILDDKLKDNLKNNLIIYAEKFEYIDTNIISFCNPIILSSFNTELFNNENYKNILQLSNTESYLYIPNNFYNDFYKEFHFFIKQNILDYDNLNQLCIMVKNAGPQFKQMLLDNLPFFDRWTILDTGSTDETINIINDVLVGKKKGNLYQEPFINFKDSRNRCLELAGTSCKFITMLDDTYVIKGNLITFLNEVRGDQYSSSFTLFIHSYDTKYGSNRIIKTNSGLRYIHKIHEVITDKDNINIVIPEDIAYIDDGRFDYMEKRTMDRKQLDLKLLYEEVEENPNDPRAYYYLAQTYNLIEDYEKAFFYFMKRSEFINSGFLQERVDAAFEAARIANFKLNKPWTLCEELYLKAFKIDESRPESLYFIGIHYYLENNYKKAFPYFKQGFEIGFPQHCQYSLKPTLSFHFLPKFLTKICYELQEYDMGLNASKFFLANNNSDAEDYQEIQSWYKIFEKLTIYKGPKIPKIPQTPILCFIADGGFNPWAGSNIITTGVGGSETYIIEMANYIQKLGYFDVYVFCNTPEKKQEFFKGVMYNHLSNYYEFINTNYVHTCIISRFSEYLPVTFKGFSENVYLVIHDLTPSGIIIPLDIKLKNIFCLTEWHVEYFTNCFRDLKNITVPFYYGIDDRFKNKNNITKIKNKFIYSSFPNRGLLQLLQMWPKIYEKESTSTLHIYSDINNKWSNDVESEKMQHIKNLLNNYKYQTNRLGIYYYGWVSKTELANAWLTSEFWLYPCTFMETFCLTALEAASSKTFVVTNDLAALQNTVGNRGVIIKGDPITQEWQENALSQIFFYMDENNKADKQNLIEMNYEWAKSLSWENQAKKLLDEYILQEKLEYKGMYNWTNDLPYGHKKYFLEAIQYFNNNYTDLKKNIIKILEVGTYTGISLINIVKLIPNSIGVGLDKWADYNEVELLNNINALKIESSFYKNIRTEGLEDRIKGIKGDSYEVLFQMINNNERFHFIYIDGSHLAFDCYSDLILSWRLLEKGGLLAIDDYVYNREGAIIDSPFEGVNHFLNKFHNEFKILHKDYRVFLIKL